MLDDSVLKLLGTSSTNRIFDEAIRKHSKDTAFVLVGAYGGTPEIRDAWTIEFAQRFNSAFLYKADGTKSTKRYDKIHLVAFGEFVPFRKSIPWLYNLLMKFTPYDYDYSLDAGTNYTIFEMPTSEDPNQNPYPFSVMICYEDAVPVIARKFTLDKQNQKRIDWLINISNDGWFVKFKGGKVLHSTELSQHTAVCVFRAIENRLAILRSVNTGISCLIDTAGRIKNGFLAGTLPHRAMERTGCAGWFVDKVPIDKRTTFFSKYGQWLDFCCTACLFSLIIVLLLGRFVRSRKYTTGSSGTTE